MSKLWTFLVGVVTAIIGFLAYNKKQERPKTKQELELDKKEAKVQERLEQINQELEQMRSKVSKEDMTDEEWKSYWKKQ